LVAPIVITVLAFLHILSGMAWLGGAVLFASVVAPGLRKVSPPARLEFLAKVGPTANRFFVGVATSTIVFGLALLFSFFGSDYSLWPSSIIVGFSLGFIAYLTGMVVTVPTLSKAFKLAKDALAMGAPSPQLAVLMKRSGISSGLTAILLVMAVVFMVATGFPF
jgi:uncharacterized membrane protein